MNEKQRKICEFIAHYFHIDENQMYGYSRKENIVMARHLAWYILHVDHKISTAILSKEFFRSKRVIFFGVNKIRNGIENQKYYRSIYNDFMEEYKKRGFNNPLYSLC